MITVGIPIFNGAKTIKDVLDRLTLQQIANLNVIVYDNGSSDGTSGMMGELVARKYYQQKHGEGQCTLNLNYFVGTHEAKHPYDNALRTRHLISGISKNEYLFFLDSDVILPPNALLTLKREFDKSDAMYMSIMYDPMSCPNGQSCGFHSHVMFGASLWKKIDFDRLPDGYDPSKGCDCKFSSDWAISQKRPAKYHSWLMAYHSKHF